MVTSHGRLCGRKGRVAAVPYIHTVSYDDSDGMLRREYDAAIQRAGKVFHVVSIQSLHPRVLRASIALYQTLMMGEGALPRWTRELLAVVVSRANGCHY
jgi:alkylhydroperoxidase family enzyme